LEEGGDVVGPGGGPCQQFAFGVVGGRDGKGERFWRMMMGVGAFMRGGLAFLFQGILSIVTLVCTVEISWSSGCAQ
jgi:hypothetical protein